MSDSIEVWIVMFDMYYVDSVWLHRSSAEDRQKEIRATGGVTSVERFVVGQPGEGADQ